MLEKLVFFVQLGFLLKSREGGEEEDRGRKHTVQKKGPAKR
jgi:hypothetical protein